MESLKIGFVGGGNMATGICEGIIKKGLVQYSNIYVSDPGRHVIENWSKKGANVSAENGRIVEESDIIFLAIKPNYLSVAVEGILKTSSKPEKLHNKLFVSILAGVTVESVEFVLKDFKNSRVIRVMPNTPMMVGAGCSAYCSGKNVTKNDTKIVEQILSSCGVCSEIPESLMDPFGALAGSGPAFIYTIIEALADGGVRMGLPRAMANQFAAQMTLGSAKLVLESGRHTAVLREEVCSPGGTTIEGIYAMEKSAIRSALMNAVEAATIKSVVLGQKHGKKE